MKKLLNEVAEEIKPDKEYEKEILDKAHDIIRKINSKLKGGKAVLGGSGAKGTWLRTFDVDIFVKFSYSKFKDKSDDLSDAIEKVLKGCFGTVSELHGSRNYFRLKEGSFTFEIIPILDIKKAEQAKNITDVSPLHSKFVNGYKKLTDEIRLTKQFCKASGAYGAESYIQGFSGYVCEILAIHYGSFLKLIKEGTKWKDKEVVDVKKYFKGKDVFKIINKSKLVSPLVVIDPVQKDRNAAAALSIEKFELFKSKAKEFLKKPSKEFFIVKEFSVEDLKKKFKSKNLVLMEVNPLKGKEDVAGAKLLKSFEFLNKELGKEGFKIIDKGWHWDKKTKAYFYFVFDNKLLSATEEIVGPPLRIRFHAEKFKKKYKKAKVKGKRIVAVVKRKFRKPEDYVKLLVKDDYVKERVNNITILK